MHYVAYRRAKMLGKTLMTDASMTRESGGFVGGLPKQECERLGEQLFFYKQFCDEAEKNQMESR